MPGFNPVWDYQPLLTELTRAAGVETDLRDRQPDRSRAALPGGARERRRTGRRAPSPARELPTGLDEELLQSFARLTEATKRTFRAGIEALREVKRDGAFFLGVDPFDPVDAVRGAADLRAARPGRGRRPRSD